MKKPKFFTQISAVISARKKKRMNAATRTAPRAAMNEYEADEPTTKLSSAFFVVFILHVVAIGGIYAFNGIKASRTKDTPPAPSAAEKKTAVKPDAKIPAPAAAATTAGTLHAAASAAAVSPAPVAATPKDTAKQYIVKAGDNATKIAIAYGLKTDDLLAANNLKEGAILRQGQPLTIPAPKPAAKPPVAETHKTEAPAKQTDVPPTRTTPGMHIVKQGETATSIAKNYGLAPADILKLNKITDAKKLQLGQALKIPPKKG